MVKRIFAALLTLAMLLSVCSVEVFAVEMETTEITGLGVALGGQKAVVYDSNLTTAFFEAIAKPGAIVEIELTGVNAKDAGVTGGSIGFQETSGWKTGEGVGFTMTEGENTVFTVDGNTLYSKLDGETYKQGKVQLYINTWGNVTDKDTTYSSKVTVKVPKVDIPLGTAVKVGKNEYTGGWNWQTSWDLTSKVTEAAEAAGISNVENIASLVIEFEITGALDGDYNAVDNAVTDLRFQAHTNINYGWSPDSASVKATDGKVKVTFENPAEKVAAKKEAGAIEHLQFQIVVSADQTAFEKEFSFYADNLTITVSSDAACAHDGEFTYVPNEDGTHQKVCSKCEEVVDEAEDCTFDDDGTVTYEKSEDGHTKVTTKTCTVCEGETVEKGKETAHDYKEVVTYKVTESGHIKTTTKTCSVCEYETVETGEETAHEYDETTGECVCGKEKPDCTHSTTEAVEVATNDKTHNVVCTDECGEIIGTEAHTYKDGVCTECGHKCTHASATEETVKSYKDNEDGTHTLTTTVTSTCADCETVTEKTTETVEKHTFKDGKCVCEADEPEITVEVEQKEGAPAASVNTSAVEALKKEFGADASEDVEVSLVVEDATATVPAADKALVELDTTYTVGQYLNIELLVNEAPKTEVSTKVTITIAIPESLLAENRTFSIVHVHDGLVSVLQDEDSDPLTITFSTSKFSTFAIVHRDAPAKEKETTVGRTPDMPNTRFGAYIVDMGPYHGVIYGGRIISMPHTYNAAGVCTSCGHER